MRTLAALTLLLAGAVWGQGTAVDCTPGTFTFTSATTGTSVSNANTATPCRSWEISYDAPSTLSALSIQFETSPDNTTWTAVPNTLCSSTVQPPCVIDGANPSTTTGNQTFSVRAYGRYVRPNVTTYTGSGTLTVRLYGYKGLSASAGSGSGGGGTSNLTIAGTTNQITVTGAGCTPANSGTCTIKLPNPNVTIDPTTGNFTTPGNYQAGLGSGKTGAAYFAGKTDGNAQGFTVADTAGVSILYLMPITAGSATTVLVDTGAVTCPDLQSGAPTTCHQLDWVQSSGTGNFVRATAVSGSILDMSAATGSNAFKVPVKASVTTTANGAIGYDSTTSMMHAAQSNADAMIPQFTATPANGDCAKWTVSGSTYKLDTAGAACGSGGGSAAGATLFSTTNSTTVTAASATTLIGTITGDTNVPANTFTAGSVMEFMAQGFYSTPLAARTLTIDLKIGGSTRITTGAVAVLPSVTNGTWRLRCVVTTRTTGSSGTQIANCIFEMAPSSLSVLTPGEASMQASSTWTVNTTTTVALDLQATWDSTTGSPTITSTNVGAWIPGAPVTSVAGLTGAVPGQGTDSKVMTAGTVSGTGATLCTDANGGATTSGCSGGGITTSTTITPNSASSAPAASVPVTGWTLQNAVNTAASVNDFYPNELVMTSGNFGTNQWAALTRSVTVPYTIIAQIQMRGTLVGNTSTFLAGVTLSDGTKYEHIGINFSGVTANARLEVRTMSTISTAGTVITGPTAAIIGLTLAVKIVNNSTNRTFSYWSNGAWVQFLQEASGTFLTETAAGIDSFLNVATGGYALDTALRYWSVQ